jgi:translation initiation factor IF-3
MFRGREMAHAELGRKLLDKLADELKDLAKVEAPPRQEGRTMILLLTPVTTSKSKPARRPEPSEPEPASQES